MIVNNITADMGRNIYKLVINAPEYTNIIAEFNGFSTSGIKVGNEHNFEFNINLMDCVVIFKSDGIIILRSFIVKNYIVEVMDKLNNLNWGNNKSIISLIPSREAINYTEDISFIKADEYDRGLYDGLLLGQMI